MSERYDEDMAEYLSFDFESYEPLEEDDDDEPTDLDDSFEEEPEDEPFEEAPSAPLHVISPDMAEICEEAIGYKFKDRRKLEHSLTHSSLARTRLDSNERLEFLGDSIMGVVICLHLYQTYPGLDEGEMTRIKSAVVSRHTCTQISERLGLNHFLLLGKGLSSRSRVPPSILAAVFEALVAGVFLDGGFDAAQRFVMRCMLGDVERVAGSVHAQNYKSMLQQVAQKKFGQTPQYRTMDEKGPDHSKCFEIAAAVGPRLFPPSWGPSKKEAEQNAARNALEEILRENGSVLD